MSYGIDEAWSKVDPKVLASLGYSFVIGYLGQDESGKNLNIADVLAIHQAGLDVGLVYEFNPQSAIGGKTQGIADADIAVSGARALGAPSGVAIYFAVDWDVTDGQKAAVLEYMKAAQNICIAAGYGVGVYSGYWTCKYLYDNGWSGYLWQTYAWSGGNWHPNAVLRQIQNGVSIGGADVDRNQSMSLKWGQWSAKEGSTVGQADYYQQQIAFVGEVVRALVKGPDANGKYTFNLPWSNDNFTTNPDGSPAFMYAGWGITAVQQLFDSLQSIKVSVATPPAVPVSITDAQVTALANQIVQGLAPAIVQELTKIRITTTP